MEDKKFCQSCGMPMEKEEMCIRDRHWNSKGK